VDPAITCEQPRSAAWIRVTTVAVAACVVASAFGEYSSGSRGALFALEIAVGVAAVALVPFLFRRPVAPALGLAVLAALAPTATPASTIGTLQVARTRPAPVAVGVAAAGIAGHLLRFLWIPTAGLPFGWWALLVVVAHAALVGWGMLGAARSALIASLRERAERAEAEQGRRVTEARAAERAAIAREMHDVLAHRLSLLATYAGALEYRPDAPPERMSEAAGVIRSSAHQALDELRDVITLLNDDPAEDEPDRPLPALADLPGLVAETRAVGTPVEVRDEVADAGTLPGRTGRTAYRVLQEALTNARKHAPGQPVSIALDGTPGARLVIEVRNALPREPVAVPAIPGAGRGLLGLTERVRLAGGRLDHVAGPGEFRLHAELPWPG
jgi:signal transduction histidine kinase